MFWIKLFLLLFDYYILIKGLQQNFLSTRKKKKKNIKIETTKFEINK